MDFNRFWSDFHGFWSDFDGFLWILVDFHGFWSDVHRFWLDFVRFWSKFDPKFNFDENYKTASDGDFWLRCAIGGAIMEMVNHPVGLYFENPKGRSTNPETLQEMIDEVNTMRKKHLESLK